MAGPWGCLWGPEWFDSSGIVYLEGSICSPTRYIPTWKSALVWQQGRESVSGCGAGIHPWTGVASSTCCLFCGMWSCCGQFEGQHELWSCWVGAGGPPLCDSHGYIHRPGPAVLGPSRSSRSRGLLPRVLPKCTVAVEWAPHVSEALHPRVPIVKVLPHCWRRRLPALQLGPELPVCLGLPYSPRWSRSPPSTSGDVPGPLVLIVRAW